MSLTNHIQLPSPQGNSYNDEWTIKLPGGYVYHTLTLVTNLVNVLTSIAKITIDIGGTPVATATAKELDVLDKAFGKHQAQGVVVFDLAKFEHREPAGIFQTSLPTSVYDDITLKIEFGAQGANPGTPELKAKADVSMNPSANLQGGGRTAVPIRIGRTLDSPGAGEFEFAYPGGNSSRRLQRMVFDESNVNISRVKIFRGTRLLDEMTREDIDFMLQRKGGVQLQAGYLILDWTVLGFGRNGAENTKGLNFKFDVDGAGAIKYYTEGYELLG